MQPKQKFKDNYLVNKKKHKKKNKKKNKKTKGKITGLNLILHSKYQIPLPKKWKEIKPAIKIIKDQLKQLKEQETKLLDDYRKSHPVS